MEPETALHDKIMGIVTPESLHGLAPAKTLHPQPGPLSPGGHCVPAMQASCEFMEGMLIPPITHPLQHLPLLSALLPAPFT